MLESLAFVSYRRDDTAPFALALKSELEKRLANTLVFVDMLRINPADVWPDVLTDSLERARCVLVLIGERWLEPESGTARPRLFDDKDWVLGYRDRLGGQGHAARRRTVVGIAEQAYQHPGGPTEPGELASRCCHVGVHPDRAAGLERGEAQIRWRKPNPIKRLAPAATQKILQELRAEGILKNWRVELEHDYAGDGTFAEQLVLRLRF
jgi:hypothetical protein